MLEEQVFYFFYKIKTTTKGQEFVRQQKWARALDGAIIAQIFPDCVIHVRFFCLTISNFFMYIINK